MKYTSRIQPFVSVTRKEADAIEMEGKLVKILKNKKLDPLTKNKMVEDSIARLNNYKEDAEISRDATEPQAVATPLSPPTLSTSSSSSPPVRKVYPKTTVQRKKPTTATTTTTTSGSKRRKKKLPVLKVVSPKPPKVIPLQSTHLSTDTPILSNIPSFMQPTTASRQKGSGHRLYVKAWK